MSINQTYQQIFDYYSDIKRTDDLKGLCESKFLNRELITDLINYAANKNQEYTLYFIGKNIPVFEGDLSFAEPFEFINNYGFDPKYLSILPKAIGINEYLTFYYLKEKNFEITVLQALYLSNPAEYQKFIKKILEENKIVDDEQKEIKQIKINYLEKKKDLTEKKKIEKLLAEEIKEIEKILSKANFQKIKDVLQSFKTPDQEKYAVTDKVISNEFYQLGKMQTYEGHYKFLGRYLYQIDSKYKKIKLIDLQTKSNHEYAFEDFQESDIYLIIKNDPCYYCISGSRIKEFPVKERKFHFEKLLSKFGLSIFIGIVFGLLLTSGILGSLRLLNLTIKLESLNGLYLLYISCVLFLFMIYFLPMIIKNSTNDYSIIINQIDSIEGNSKILKDNLIVKINNLIFKGKFCFIHKSNTSIVYETELIKPNDCKLSGLKDKTITIDKNEDIENIRKEAEAQLTNTSDADQIVKINIQTKDKIKNLIDFSYVLGILKSVSSEELVDKTNRETFDSIIKYCFTLKNENLNNYILDTWNRKRIRLSNDNILGLISENQCDKELLNTNMTVIENIETIEFILKNIKITQLHKVFILNTLNSLSQGNKDDKTLVQLSSMRSSNMMNLIKTTQGDYDAFLLNKVEVLINQYGSSSSTIEITENGNSNSKDIEVK
ncbi:MAG: hypothetical protein RBS89_01010 [Candidatus Delongbacteria bacterium]|nr:hypothetical protein [Candidatus Delongbacteria bacterium]